jgi:hypothetical protein
MDMRSILLPFDLFYGHLVYFVANSVSFSRFGILFQEKSGNRASHPRQPKGKERANERFVLKSLQRIFAEAGSFNWKERAKNGSHKKKIVSPEKIKLLFFHGASRSD